MNCPTCGEAIPFDLISDETAECECCLKKMHTFCAAYRVDPVDEYFRTILPSVPAEGKRTWCFPCYEARAVIVREAMIGVAYARAMTNPNRSMRSVLAAIRSSARDEWTRKYKAILDAWPHEPKKTVIPRKVG